MQIIINQKEIEKAIKLYLSNQIMVRNLADVSIELIATRSGEGVKAIIDFTETAINPQNMIVPPPGVRDISKYEEEGTYTLSEPEQEELPDPKAVALEPEKEPEKEESQPRRTSLFAGMTKPVNKES